MTRIVCISDTHNRGKDVVVPDGDILVHAGDLTGRGTWPEIRKAAKWLGGLPHEHKVVIAGNHDFCFQDRHRGQAEALMRDSGLTYLRDAGVELHGLKFYGSPWQPWFHDWAFNLPRGGSELKKKWAAIPDDTDVLVTHGPPHGFGDRVAAGEHVGSKLLGARLLELRPKLHVFGHIHEAYGEYQVGTTRLVNASICTLQYEPTNKPIVVEL